VRRACALQARAWLPLSLSFSAAPVQCVRSRVIRMRLAMAGGPRGRLSQAAGVAADRSVLRSPPSVGTRVHADRHRRRMGGARGPVVVTRTAVDPSVLAASAHCRTSPAPPAACAGLWGAWGADLVGRGLSPTLSFGGCRTVLARAGVPAVSCPPYKNGLSRYCLTQHCALQLALTQPVCTHPPLRCRQPPHPHPFRSFYASA